MSLVRVIVLRTPGSRGLLLIGTASSALWTFFLGEKTGNEIATEQQLRTVETVRRLLMRGGGGAIHAACWPRGQTTPPPLLPTDL